MYKAFLVFLFLLMQHHLRAQSPQIDSRWLNGFWQARWIACPEASGTQFGVYHFRKSFSLNRIPQTFIIHVSADNRYRLFVNGKSIGTGPARSDLANWHFETYDIAPYLQPGDNTLAATVWNFGEYRPYSQISFQTAFIVQGNSPSEALVNTDQHWKVYPDDAYRPLPVNKAALQAYFVTAEGEQVEGMKYPWGFELPGYNDTDWKGAQVLWYAAKSRSYGTDGNWQLVPRTIPLEEETLQYFGRVVAPASATAYSSLSRDGSLDYTVAAGSKARLLIDQQFLTNAYPHLELAGGKDAVITLSYAEALFDSLRNKGNRDSTQGKRMIGYSDRYISNGGNSQHYAPLYFRTFRYLQIDIETKQQPVTLTKLYSYFTGYPFRERASFRSSQPALQAIWKVGWRTARLCATDTYFDCPYYEQLQYVGDTRIQALISLYVSGDDRLMRKAIDDIAHSFIPDGLTQSRYPSRDLQVIPPFSLWWVCMIHDYWMHRKDDAFIKAHLEGIASVLRWYRRRIAENGLLGPLSWWQFTDWSWGYVDSIRVGGVPPGASHGGSAILTLQYAYTLQRAAELMRYFGERESAQAFQNESLTIAQTTYQRCWNPTRGLMADTHEQNSYSQHANILAILTNTVPEADQPQLIEKVIRDTSLTSATFYFRFYLFEALKKTQRGDLFLQLLQPWYQMLNRGLTTFAEQDDPTRSDCHAWSASPNYQLLSLVCGIRPSSPGFKSVLIEPSPGSLEYVQGAVPIALGQVTVNFSFVNQRLEGTVDLPPGMTGTLKWKGKELPLKAGKQQVKL